jgi:hypothetical protein
VVKDERPVFLSEGTVFITEAVFKIYEASGLVKTNDTFVPFSTW